MITNLLASVATFAAQFGSQACFFVLVDEPECPKALIK